MTETKPPLLKRRPIQLVLLAILVAGGAFTIKHTRHSFIAKRFMQIEPGLFRSAQMREWPYERVVKTHGIKTVLRLNKSPHEDDPGWKAEDAIVARNGLKLIFIPMHEGSGIVPYDQLDEAADLLNDPSLRPMLFHCAAGNKRSASVHAVWRMRHCGYTWEQADKELREFGLRPGATRLLDHLEGYYTQRVLGKERKTGAEVAPVKSESKTPSR